ncbi:hypothetical protein D0Y65_053128 [Glycine soja]|uniref:Reverse transcriptase zinc-binding domain-containing protein n=1 Tax=Glycine soja TaxID=3848 RepID=A0A445F0R9_GLYSO|nr:hypothetical protein D0Y65_053128 [Glycine soja]
MSCKICGFLKVYVTPRILLREGLFEGSNYSLIGLTGTLFLDQPKSKGGLGVRATKAANVAMLGKRIWTILHNPTKLWVQLVNAKCGSSNETIFHHLLDCPKAPRIWNRVNLDVQQHNLQQDRST